MPAGQRFRAAGNRGLMPTEVRCALEQLRFPSREYKNILSSIHTVIRRLDQSGEIGKAIHDLHDAQDKSVYQWAGPNYGASNSLANQMAGFCFSYTSREGLWEL
jgi:hypothetical protein